MRALLAVVAPDYKGRSPILDSGDSCGVVKLSGLWCAFHAGEIDESMPFVDKLDALDWLRLLVRADEIKAKRAMVPA